MISSEMMNSVISLFVQMIGYVAVLALVITVSVVIVKFFIRGVMGRF